MPVICHAEACRVMILFIGVSLQTYFITPCALEFLGCVGSGCPSPAHSPPFSPWRSSPPPASSAPGARSAHAPSSLQLAEGRGALPPDCRTCSVSWGPLRTAASLAAQDLPLCAQWRHPRQRRRRRQPRPPQTLLFPVLNALSLLFHLPRKRTIAGKSFALCTWEAFRGRRKIPAAASPSGIWTLERLRAAWGCQRGARRPGAGALRAGARPSCRSLLLLLCPSAYGAAAPGRRRLPILYLWKTGKWNGVPQCFPSSHLGPHHETAGLQEGPLCFLMTWVCWDPKVKSMIPRRQIRSCPRLLGKENLITKRH